MKQRVTSNKQLFRGSSWLLLSALLSYCALNNHWISLEEIYTQFLTFNSVLMGFVITALTIKSSTLGTPLIQRLQEDGSYYSIMTNFYWLFILLFVNVIFGFIFLLITKETITHGIIDFLILMDITILLILLWYAVSRLIRILRKIKNS